MPRACARALPRPGTSRGTQRLLENSNLPLDHLLARASDRVPILHTLLKVEHAFDILVEHLAQAFVVLQTELVDLNVPRLC